MVSNLSVNCCVKLSNLCLKFANLEQSKNVEFELGLVECRCNARPS